MASKHLLARPPDCHSSRLYLSRSHRIGSLFTHLANTAHSVQYDGHDGGDIPYALVALSMMPYASRASCSLRAFIVHSAGGSPIVLRYGRVRARVCCITPVAIALDRTGV